MFEMDQVAFTQFEIDTLRTVASIYRSWGDMAKADQYETRAWCKQCRLDEWT